MRTKNIQKLLLLIKICRSGFLSLLLCCVFVSLSVLSKLAPLQPIFFFANRASWLPPARNHHLAHLPTSERFREGTTHSRLILCHQEVFSSHRQHQRRPTHCCNSNQSETCSYLALLICLFLLLTRATAVSLQTLDEKGSLPVCWVSDLAHQSFLGRICSHPNGSFTRCVSQASPKAGRMLAATHKRSHDSLTLYTTRVHPRPCAPSKRRC